MQKAFIEAFLASLRKAIANNGLEVIPRYPNNQALIDLGLTPKGLRKNNLAF
jgi:hypothetical protein